MEDCNCKKTENDTEWINEGEYGDDFLKSVNSKMIQDIRRDIENYSVNEEAVFNKEFQSNELDSIVIEN